MNEKITPVFSLSKSALLITQALSPSFQEFVKQHELSVDTSKINEITLWQNLSKNSEYYIYFDEKQIVIAFTFESLIERGLVKINDSSTTRFWQEGIEWFETIWHNIYRIPSGNSVNINALFGLTCKHFNFFDPPHKLARKENTSLADLLIQSLTNHVQTKNIAINLSGGFDSTSILYATQAAFPRGGPVRLNS